MQPAKWAAPALAAAPDPDNAQPRPEEWPQGCSTHDHGRMTLQPHLWLYQGWGEWRLGCVLHLDAIPLPCQELAPPIGS